MNLKSSITELKGIGEKTSVPFAKAGIFTVEDLLRYYPRSYENFQEPVDIEQIEDGEKGAFYAWVQSVSPVKRVKRYQIFSAQLRAGETIVQATWFNMPFLRNFFQKGGQYIFRGTVSVKNGQYRIQQPEHYTLAEYDRLLPVMHPKYPLTAGLTEKMVVKAVRQVLDGGQVWVKEFLPESIREAYGLEKEWDAVREIHFPVNEQRMRTARDRIVFDEFLLFLLAVRRMKEDQEQLENQVPMLEAAETERLIASLPYQLTGAQKKVWREIVSDMTGQKVMSRLIQGDVGSGKTILAVLALVLAGCNGYQGALMVPTEVLAKQHYQSVCEILNEHQIPLRAILLTGSMSAKEKRLAREEIACGTAQIVIGTHALIQSDVEYRNLGLVITDEQHRFGVQQRERLAEKGQMPHVLVMSATPIPRTLAIILYGDLDISVLDEMPANRLPIKNCVVDESYRPNAYRFMEKEVAAGHQVYIICPMVEENEELELENVTDYTERLKAVMPERIIACLHGKMKPKEKNEIMEQYAEGRIQILVSTTVIEVGINVPNATVMMVENAERFGLAQLHQLRGRVGRGKAQSYCIFMSGSKGKETRQRLEVLNHSNDGFYIANEDLKLRGPGDLFGIRQSGILEFRVGDVFQDARILSHASEAADRIMEEKWLTSLEYEELRRRLKESMNRGTEGFSL